MWEEDLTGSEKTKRLALILALAVLCCSCFAEPPPAATWLQQGEKLRREGEAGGGAASYRLAEDAFRRALALEPGSAAAAQGLAAVLMRLGKTPEALAVVAGALQASPNDAALRARLGYAARYAGYAEASIQAYRHAARLDSSTKNAIRTREQIAKAHIYQGRYSQSLDLYEEILELSAGQRTAVRGKTVFYAGLAFLYKGEAARAGTYFEQAAAREGDSLWGQFAVAYKYLAVKNIDALKAAASALSVDTARIADGERRYRMVHLYTAAGDYDAALGHFAAAVGAGNFNYPYFASDALINPLRDFPRFQRILADAEKRHKSISLDLSTLR